MSFMRSIRALVGVNEARMMIQLTAYQRGGGNSRRMAKITWVKNQRRGGAKLFFIRPGSSLPRRERNRFARSRLSYRCGRADVYDCAISSVFLPDCKGAIRAADTLGKTTWRRGYPRGQRSFIGPLGMFFCQVAWSASRSLRVCQFLDQRLPLAADPAFATGG